MVYRTVRLRTTSGDPSDETSELNQVFASIRDQLRVPGEFDEVVLAEADRCAGEPQAPDQDLTALPFVTVDPPGATDLDQALLVERGSAASGGGYRVRYAIADVSAFLQPGGAVDAEARRRGQTIYLPDRRVPLHPPVLSEGSASLLPGQTRPAFVWDLRLDDDGLLRSADVTRAWVRSVERLDYATVQRSVDVGEDRFAALRDLGERRIVLQRQRGGASLPVPDQEVAVEGGRYHLRLRAQLRAEEWNAQVSLLTGMAAADIMLAGQVGVVRTLPAPRPGAVSRFRRQAAALGVPWSAEQRYGDFLAGLDTAKPGHLALVHEATGLFRGAGYTPFDGAPPEYAEHAAVGDQYAHVTAPLRRLVDRFGLVICTALCRDEEIPIWVREVLPQLPALMSAADRRAGQVERACTDAVEAAVLRSRVGETFDAVVVDVEEAHGVVQLIEPAVLARVTGRVSLGDTLTVRLVTADLARRVVEFTPA
ncbi:MAG: RNB domain-containing ribonuclease [Angustibacter sp.]